MGLLEDHVMGVTAEAAPEDLQLPCPGFEGFEKRLEVHFELASGVSLETPFRGLRDIPRGELDAMLEAAQCTIVSRLSNKSFDSYVLSESSLFVYPLGVVIKTCGTTRLLRAIPGLLASAAALGFQPHACRYTRGSFIFPDAQPAPHHDFAAEAAELDQSFGHLGQGGRAYVMGDALSGSRWHVYSASSLPPRVTAPQGQKGRDPVLTLEVCMTGLDPTAARIFFADAGVGDAKAVTAQSGIGALLPGASIDDFSFSPCGYSMNGVEGPKHSTIHVTPEDGFSYASFEASGYSHDMTDLAALLGRVLAVFKPAKASVALHANGPAPASSVGDSWWGSLAVPAGYWCSGSSQQQLQVGSCTVFHTLQAAGAGTLAAHHGVTPLPLAAVAGPKGEELACGAAAGVKAGKLALPWLNGAEKVPEHGWLLEAEGSPADGPSEEGSDAVLGALAKRGQGVLEAVTALHPVLLARGEKEQDGFCAEVISARTGVAAAERAFYVMDVGEVLRLWDLWARAMPRVHPYYAVKCNPDKALLQLLASLGAGFDVASLAELQAVESVMGGRVPGDRVIFANPCKLPSHISAAAARGVHRSTFDSESELHKLRRSDPHAAAVLRIRVDDPSARCPLGVKYGAELGECRRLLYTARRLGVEVQGVAFHVGSGAGDAAAFSLGVSAARAVFDMAVEVGFRNMRLLDIGGGFTADGSAAGGVSFQEAGMAVHEALEKCFPLSDFPGLAVIAEPGRFFAETPYTLVAHVFGTRARGRGSKRRYEYWIDDGIYGSMNSLLYDHAVLSVRPLRMASGAHTSMGPGGAARHPTWAGTEYLGRGKHHRVYSSTVFGPTCDGLDTLLRDIWLPKLECGDWLVFPRMGAYTKAAGSSFNGFSMADITTAAYVLTSEAACPFYADTRRKGAYASWNQDVGHGGEVPLGEWYALEGSSSEDEDGVTWEGEGCSSGSDSDE